MTESSCTLCEKPEDNLTEFGKAGREPHYLCHDCLNFAILALMRMKDYDPDALAAELERAIVAGLFPREAAA